MNNRAGFYQSNISSYKLILSTLKKKHFYNAVLRLISFALIATFIYRALVTGNLLYVVATVAALVVFLGLVKRSATLNATRKLNENLLFINNNELGIINNTKNLFDDGNIFKSNESYYEDLDIFGPGSLFELVNRTATHYGKLALAANFKNPLLNGNEITNQQEALKVLATQPQQLQTITAVAITDAENQGNLNQLIDWVQQPAILHKNKWLLFARYALPVLNTISLIICLNIDQYYLLTLTMIISWVHIGYISKHTGHQSLVLSKKQEALNAYATILKEYKNIQPGASIVLQKLQSQTHSATNEIKKLAQLANLLDQRHNILVNVFMNGFLAYDLQCLLSLETWKQRNQHHLPGWIDCIGQVESLVSLSVYTFNHAENSFPTPLTGEPSIQGKGLYHPLIPMDSNISNDISIGNPAKLLLITGSNMSGKTTYLRTVGTNILMAQCGLPVCAAHLQWVPVQIFTSIRISDSLQQHTSYFMAELKRLQYIKNNIQSATPSLVLIDEILRGTNSVDKYHGSEQFVKRLIQYNCLTLFATHDLKLSVLEDEYPQLIENYCFESIIENDELLFDYKVLRGVARNKNASFLMQKMNII